MGVVTAFIGAPVLIALIAPQGGQGPVTATQLRAPDAPILPSGVRTVRVGGASLRVHLRSAILTIVVLAGGAGHGLVVD